MLDDELRLARWIRRILAIVVGLLVGGCVQPLLPVRVGGEDGAFVLGDTGRGFVPWGFNYDHDGDGRLIEDYWLDEWGRVDEDFREMRELGANTVRVHLQLGKFMAGPDRPDEVHLDRLGRLLQLAERERLYLILTGLACYHKKDVPPWYDLLSESERWDVQGRFWRAVARRCRQSPAVFCYDLMNEPVAPGGPKKRTDWLGKAFAGKCFVQFIALETRGRDRPEIALQWIRRLKAAIRAEDPTRPITVGLVPWSLDRPGLTSGFTPQRIGGELDFISVHIYPERGKVDAALETLRGFAVGKPVLIEETFPLKCDIDELAEFFDASRATAAGWIGFYWGKTPAEYRPPRTIPDALTLKWLEFFQKNAARYSERP